MKQHKKVAHIASRCLVDFTYNNPTDWFYGTEKHHSTLELVFKWLGNGLEQK